MQTSDIQAGKVFERSAVEIRSLTEAEKATREFTAIGVPYGQRIQIGPDLYEEFAPGSIENAERALILWNHRDHEVLGKLASSRDTDAGFELTARLSDTDRGREAYTLLQDEVIDRLSIGFQMQEYRIEQDEATGADVLIHTKVRALEFSLCPFPAYDGASVTEVRHLAHNTSKETPVTDILTRNDVDNALEPLAQSVQTLERSVAQLRGSTSAPGDEITALASHFRSLGEFAQAVSRGDENAVALHRAAQPGNTTGTLSDAANSTFIGNQIRFVDERRDTVNMFQRGVIPAKGMSIDYRQLDTSTFLVGKQAAELDALPGPSLVTFKDASAPVETYGGWTRLSRQAIERADVPYVDSVLTGMTLEYARVTDAAVRTRLVTELDGILAAGGGLDLGAAATAATVGQWAGVIVDAGEEFSERGYKAAGLAVSSDIFKALATQTATDGRPLMNLTGTGVNVSGTVNLMQGDGELLRVPVKVLRGTSGRAFFWDPVAVKVLESAAPVLLQDDDITILGRDFSIYGYQAITVPFANALLPIEFAV